MASVESDPPRGKSALEKAKLIAVVISAIIVLIVVLQNTEAVETKILFLTITMPRAALLLGTLLIGLGLGFLVGGHFFPKKSQVKDTGAPPAKT